MPWRDAAGSAIGTSHRIDNQIRRGSGIEANLPITNPSASACEYSSTMESEGRGEARNAIRDNPVGALGVIPRGRAIRTRACTLKERPPALPQAA